jgi:hypothetical protein
VTEAIALGLHGCVRATLDLDVVVLADELPQTVEGLRAAGFETEEVVYPDEIEPQYVLTDPETRVTVDVLVGFGEPEFSLVDGATRMPAAGIEASVARAEHLLVSYLYSNQPRHTGDFAALVQSGELALPRVRELLADMHPEMVPVLEERWAAAENPPPPPPRPPRKRA